MNKHIGRYLLIFLFLCIPVAYAAPIPGLVNPGYLTVGLVNLESNYVNFKTGTDGVITAQGFDVDMYCYIAQQLGLKIKFLGYAPSTGTFQAANPYGHAGVALDALQIDCFGGADFFLANVSYPEAPLGLTPVIDYSDYYGIVTSVYPTVPTYLGIAFLNIQQATLTNLRCELLQLVQQAVDNAVRTGYWTCALRNNNADGEYVTGNNYIDLTGNNRSPEALLSSTLGLIPIASSQGIMAEGFGCTKCVILPVLPKRSCLVNFLATQASKNCNKIVTMASVPG